MFITYLKLMGVWDDLASKHNLQFYLWLMKEVRAHIKRYLCLLVPSIVRRLESKVQKLHVYPLFPGIPWLKYRLQ